MNITVFSGSQYGSDPEYKKVAEQLGTDIAKKGYTLVYGGSKSGLMASVSDAVINNGGKTIGVFAEVLSDREEMRDNLTEAITVNSISERKQKMIELGDVFIALPGGPGTMEELWEVVSLSKVNIINKPCLILNINGYYDSVKALIHEFFDKKFVVEGEMDKVFVVDSLKEAEEILNTLILENKL